MITAPQSETALEENEPWTYTRYLRETAEGEYFAVIEGTRISPPRTNSFHQTALLKVCIRLEAFVKQHRLGIVVLGPIDVYLSDTNFVQPDLLFVAKAHTDRITDNGIMGAPDLVIEIISPGSTRADRVTKRQLYARYGVPEYWIISPNERSIEVLSLKAGIYEAAGLYENSEVLASPLLAGFAIKPDELFDE
jgi:Uma2 family endonuclease